MTKPRATTLFEHLERSLGKTTNMNANLGVVVTGKTHGSCKRCLVDRENGELNYEAVLHHGASEVICIDRKRCERACRKKRRRAK